MMRETVLSILSESPLPIPTADLVALCDPLESDTRVAAARLRSRVWSVLAHLCVAGLVRKVTDKDHKSGMPVRWVSTKFDQPQPGARP